MLKTILIALDCSDLSELVIEALSNLKLEAQTKIIFSHVLPATNPDGNLEAERPHLSEDSAYQNAENHLRAYQKQFPSSEIEIVRGDPAEEIIRLANIYQADLIAIGTRDLKGVKRVIEGSVSSQVVADAACSVLVVKS